MGPEGGGLAEVVIGFEAGLLRDQLAEDPPAEVELPGLGVVALLGIEGQGQQVMDVASQEARALGVFGGFRLGRKSLWVELLDVPVEGKAEEALVQAGWQPCPRAWAGSVSGSANGWGAVRGGRLPALEGRARDLVVGWTRLGSVRCHPDQSARAGRRLLTGV